MEYERLKEKVLELWGMEMEKAEIAEVAGVPVEMVAMVLRMEGMGEKESEEKRSEEKKRRILEELEKIAFDELGKPGDKLKALVYLHEEETGRNAVKAKMPVRESQPMVVVVKALKAANEGIMRRLQGAREVKVIEEAAKGDLEGKKL